jgi:hypothetical protein
MKRPLLATATLVAALSLSPGMRATNDALLEAHLAWDRGDYVAALTSCLELLESDNGGETFDAIALLTGELYSTTELTAAGASPQFSPDGRFAAYESGSGLNVSTRLHPLDGSTSEIIELPGTGAAFSPDGSRVAYLALTPTPELEAAQAAVDRATSAERRERTTTLNDLRERAYRIVTRDLATGRETEVRTANMRKTGVLFGTDGLVLFAGGTPEDPAQIYAVRIGAEPQPLTTDPLQKSLHSRNASGTAVMFTTRPAASSTRAAPTMSGVINLPSGTVTMLEGTAPSFSPDGDSLTYVARTSTGTDLIIAAVDDPDTRTVVRRGPERVDNPALSPGGRQVVFQMMLDNHWEVFVMNRDGTNDARLTREIQHDVLPRFIGENRVLAAIGEARHRRSYLYDLPSGRRTRLFHNNTVRTIAPEYAWVPNADGTKILVSAERDGDTVSPERGIYLVDLTRKVTHDELRARVRASLAAERELRAKADRIYAPIAAAVHDVVSEASIARVYRYEKALFDFDSKHITRPGNRLASAYLYETYKSFGYQPEYQWFSPRGALGGQTANVLATLPGTTNPDLIYVVSSHYDSVAAGPGADDDSSGTAALLETARILARHPQPATIVFASFTGEESGLLGSREFVRRALDDRLRIAGALNNDMIGWSNDHRLDNTIRYSNPGIRDIQHAAALRFTELITYDALYYKNTDAAAYYDAFGDIVGGIGSYPVLGNPHYHQPHDVLETINHRLVTEVAKTTAASLMLLASSPSRLTGLQIENYRNGTASLTWTPAPEKGVTGYLVAWGPPAHPEAQRMKVKEPAAAIKAPAGTVISVKAVNEKGLEGWDWARITIK